MNRAEIRRQKRIERKKNNIYVLNQEQYEARNLQQEVSTMNTTMVSTVALMLMALRDVYGFGGIRIDRLMDNFMKKYECLVEDLCDHSLVQSEKFDFYAVIKTIKAETGFDLLNLLERDIHGNVKLKERRTNGSKA